MGQCCSNDPKPHQRISQTNAAIGARGPTTTISRNLSQQFDDVAVQEQAAVTALVGDMQAQAEHVRRGRDTAAQTSGLLVWQLNSEWPGASKSSLEYAGG